MLLCPHCLTYSCRQAAGNCWYGDECHFAHGDVPAAAQGEGNGDNQQGKGGKDSKGKGKDSKGKGKDGKGKDGKGKGKDGKGKGKAGKGKDDKGKAGKGKDDKGKDGKLRKDRPRPKPWHEKSAVEKQARVLGWNKCPVNDPDERLRILERVRECEVMLTAWAGAFSRRLV